MITFNGLSIHDRRGDAGMTLVELMVALLIGTFLMIGAVTVFMQSRTTFRMNEAVSRLQENARFVVDALEPDVRMANYFGLTARSSKVQGRATAADPLNPWIPQANDCGRNWSVNLMSEVDGTNSAYGWGDCAAFGAAALTSDTLIVRRVAEDFDAVIVPNALYVQSARFQDSQIFLGTAAAGGGVPAGYPAGTSQPHRLIVNGYYVSQNSSLDTPGNPVPSLRVKTLGVGPQVVDQEVLPGVENMQVQFGIDTDVLGSPERGTIDRYVNPGDAILNPVLNPNTEVLAVRIWLRVRAERPDVGYTDTALYNYADLPAMATPLNDRFRRVVVSKTIYLRNARPPT
jgi:type IV pilus assembly protein PilW